MSQMKDLIDHIVHVKSKGNSFQQLNIQMKLMLKGIPVKNIDEHTPDDPAMLTMIYNAAKDLNVQLPKAQVR